MRRAPVLDTETPSFEAPVEATHASVGIARRVGGFLLRGEQDEKRASIRMRQCRRRRDQRRA